MTALASTITSLTALAEHTLAVASTCLEDTTAGPPDVQYMEAGPLPAWDCAPALIVMVNNIQEDTTSPLNTSGVTGQRARFGRKNLVTLTIVVLRCAAAPDARGNVLAEDKSAVARTVQEDGWALWTGFYSAIINGTYEDLCSDVHFDAGQALEESGGIVGWEAVLRVQLGGIPA